MRRDSIAALATIAIAALALSSCGGADSVGSQGGQAIGNAFTCALFNCTASNTLPLDDVRGIYVVTQSGSDVHVTATLSKSANLLSDVQLAGGDGLSAAIGSQSAALIDVSGNDTAFAVDLSDSGAQPAVTVNFTRGGTSYPSTVTMSTQFALLAPTSALSVTRAMGSFTVQLGIANDNLLSAVLNGACTRVDGTSFNPSGQIAFTSAGAVTGGTAYTVDLNALDSTLNTMGQSANSSTPDTSDVANCSLQISWTQTQYGQTSPSLSQYSYIEGQTSVTQSVQYDAQR